MKFAVVFALLALSLNAVAETNSELNFSNREVRAADAQARAQLTDESVRGYGYEMDGLILCRDSEGNSANFAKLGAGSSGRYLMMLQAPYAIYNQTYISGLLVLENKTLGDQLKILTREYSQENGTSTITQGSFPNEKKFSCENFVVVP